MFNVIPFMLAISLTPGFSPVWITETAKNRFNGFWERVKPLKRPTYLFPLIHPAEAGC